MTTIPVTIAFAPGGTHAHASFQRFGTREILALAISLEEEDARIYDDLAEGLQESFPAAAAEFRRMRADEDRHRHRLLELFRQRFGEHIPLIRRQDVKGFVGRRPIWLAKTVSVKAARKLAETMEIETRQFYEAAARRTTDAALRQLLGDLAEEERRHVLRPRTSVPPSRGRRGGRRQQRLFVLQVVQPGLAGLMDGSVSTLAPLFAAAFATKEHWHTFKVGMAAAIGAGISMGFAEALSDDGSLTGRGRPWVRGLICGLMTALAAWVTHCPT